MLMMIDNYDSFTYNLIQYFGELNVDCQVCRNDKIDIKGLEESGMSQLVISPGPCTPNEAGISLQAIKHFAGVLPILGVCLGHQTIGQCFGGEVIHASSIMHGKTSLVYHRQQGVFKDLPNPFTAVRYHSLVINKDKLPDCLEITAWTQKENGEIEEIMGVRHKQYQIEGVQFHPESIATEHGHKLLQNFLQAR